jgi:hypothetical protein
MFDQAVAAAVRYPRTRAAQLDADTSRDELLSAIDTILIQRQHDHLDAVRAAGVSGENVPLPQPDDQDA